MFVYLLICSDDSTYVGATIDTNRRLRQHNSEIKGGAKRTTSKVSQGKTWKRVCYVSGFPDWTACLQFEWRWKQLSRKYQNHNKPLQRRLIALNELLCLTQSTSKAIPFSQWSSKPIVNVEHDFVEICPLHLHEDIQLEMSP